MMIGVCHFLDFCEWAQISFGPIHFFLPHGVRRINHPRVQLWESPLVFGASVEVANLNDPLPPSCGEDLNGKWSAVRSRLSPESQSDEKDLWNVVALDEVKNFPIVQDQKDIIEKLTGKYWIILALFVGSRKPECRFLVETSGDCPLPSLDGFWRKSSWR
jgi:hypothetical protein